MRKQKVVDKLDALRAGLSRPRYDAAFGRFLSDLKDVVRDNVPGSEEVEWDEYEGHFCFRWSYLPGNVGKAKAIGCYAEFHRLFVVSLDSPIGGQIDGILAEIEKMIDGILLDILSEDEASS